MKNETALVVDDHQDMLLAIVKHLELLDFECVSTTQGLAVIAMLQQHKPNIIFLDWSLPDVANDNGLLIANELYKRNIRIPIILMSLDDRAGIERYQQALNQKNHIIGFLIKDGLRQASREQASKLRLCISVEECVKLYRQMKRQAASRGLGDK